jgi:hypothetical protein
MVLEELLRVAQQESVSKETLALISGGSAVLGALAGGGIAGWANLRGQKTRQAFDRAEREAADARADRIRLAQVAGLAREMRSQFKLNREIYSAHRKLEFWWNHQVPSPSLFDREEDRAVLASATSADQWDAIERAETNFRYVESVRDITRSAGTRILNEEGANPRSKSNLGFEFYGAVSREEDGVEKCQAILDDAIKLTEEAIGALDPLCQ